MTIQSSWSGITLTASRVSSEARSGVGGVAFADGSGVAGFAFPYEEFSICDLRYVLLLLTGSSLFILQIDIMLSIIYFPQSSLGLVESSLAIALVSVVSLALYRIYLSPLAKFPGVKLAAATGWYEFYYDCVLPGKYFLEIKRMHELYGQSTLDVSVRRQTDFNMFIQGQLSGSHRTRCTSETQNTLANYTRIA